MRRFRNKGKSTLKERMEPWTCWKWCQPPKRAWCSRALVLCRMATWHSGTFSLTFAVFVSDFSRMFRHRERWVRKLSFLGANSEIWLLSLMFEPAEISPLIKHHYNYASNLSLWQQRSRQPLNTKTDAIWEEVCNFFSIQTKETTSLEMTVMTVRESIFNSCAN